MRTFIFRTGLMSVLAGAGLQCPAIAALLMPTEQPGMVLHVFGLVAVFLGIMLSLSARDLAHRAPLMMREEVLRVGGFQVMAGYGICGGKGGPMIGSGAFDLVVGLGYQPRDLQVSGDD